MHFEALLPLQKQTTLNFFLDCWDCDFTFVRQELEFVSFVRDPKPADVHILSSSQRTGSGGEKFFLNFIGLNTFQGQDYEYQYMADQSETRDEVRQGLLKIIKTGVLQYYSQTGFFERVKIHLEDTREMTATEIVEDPWKKWVFSIEAGGNLQQEESQDELSLGTELRIQKVTKDWKTRIEGDYNLDHENYYDDGEIEYQVVHDQLYLPAGNASLEDVLLRRRKMATGYELRLQVGFEFTFGSIYNNVVNERFQN